MNDIMAFSIIAFISLGVMILLQGLVSMKLRSRAINRALSGKQEKVLFTNTKKFLLSLVSMSNDEVEEKFIAAGFYEAKLAPYYFPLKYILTVIFLMLLWYFGGSFEMMDKIMYSMFILVALIIIPDSFLAFRKKKLSEKINRQLPYLIDLLSVCVQTGLTIEAAMFYLTKEMVDFDRDMAFMLKKVSDKAQINGIDKALNDLIFKVPTHEMRSFVFTLTQSIKYGTSIQHALDTLSKDIREVQVLALEEKVGKLSAKMSVPLILFIMFPIVILITAPGIMRMMG